MNAEQPPQSHNRQADKIATSVLGTRALNRALLARQMLLKRAELSALEAIQRLGGLQAQAPLAPYFSLWTRLEGFQPDELSDLIQERKVVRIALMRSTLHLVSAQDCLDFRPLLQSVHDRGLQGSFGKALADIHLEELSLLGRELVEAEPLTFNQLGKRLQAAWPDHDPAALSAAVRTRVPLVQLPPRGLWGQSGQATHTSAESWLGQPLTAGPSLDKMILRYLAAFGPASVKDIQVWSGLTRLNEGIERLRPELVTFRDEHGSELFDLQGAPRPDPDSPAPPRFLGEFDNMLLSYSDRTRILNELDRKRVFTVNGIIRPTILLDGFVCGTWRINRERGCTALLIEPFQRLTGTEREALTEEGLRLLQFAAADAKSHDILFVNTK